MEEFKKEVQGMLYVELKKALTTDKNDYSLEQRKILVEEWLMRGYHLDKDGNPLEKTSNNSPTNIKSTSAPIQKAPSNLQKSDLYVKDTYNIIRVYNIISIAIKISIGICMFAAFILLCTSCETNRYDELKIVWGAALPALLSLVIIPLVGYLTLLCYDIIFGFFYDVRKMRMMMEENKK